MESIVPKVVDRLECFAEDRLAAIAYYFVFFTALTPAAWVFGAAFLVGAAGFAWLALKGRETGCIWAVRMRGFGRVCRFGDFAPARRKRGACGGIGAFWGRSLSVVFL